MTATQEQGTFSLTFSVAGDYETHAVDWSYSFPGKWSHSRRAGVGWDRLGLIGRRERLVLIEWFGLQSVADELYLEVIIKLGPQALIRKRRELEEEHGLERLEVRSDTVGYNARADDHVD